MGLQRSDPRLWAVVLATFALLIWSWSRQEGYQIADSVEYLERAQGIATGRALVDSQAIRGFGFSGLLVPLYWIYAALGLDEPVLIMQAAQLLQVLLTLALVFTTARFASRLVGPVGGLAAGALLGSNPVVLRWGVEPVSGIAAALFVTLAVARALQSTGDLFATPAATGTRARRDAWLAGMWLGLAFLMAYQTVLVIGAIVCVIVVRDARRRTSHVFAMLGALLLVVLVQCVLDVWYYGSFGISLGTYLLDNFGSNFARVLHKGGSLPLVGRHFYDAAEWIYNSAFQPSENTHAYQEQVVAGAESIKTHKPFLWYFTSIGRCLVPPAAAFVALGLLLSLAHRARATALLWLVVLANVLAMSVKGSKDFRLWLPFLPLVATLGGFGLAALARRGAALQLLTAVAVLVAGIQGTLEYTSTNTRKFGGFWRAIAQVNERSLSQRALRAPGVRLRASAAYHWSMFLRESSDVELVKLPHHLDGWASYDAEARALDFATLATLDAFITHLPVLTQNPDLFEVINRDFTVVGAFYDRVVYDSLGPIYVLERRASDADGLRFFRRREGVPEDEVRRDAGHGPLVIFERAAGELREHLVLADVRYTPLDGDGHGWITYTWHGGPLPGEPWRFFDRLTAPDFENSWQNNHQPAYGMAPTNTWGADTLLEESYLVVAEAAPYQPDTAYRRLGGAWRRGDLLPLRLWMDVVRFDDAASLRTDRLPAHDPLTGEPVADVAPTQDLTSPCGATTSRDGMTRAASLFVPVHPAARLEDDGAPIRLREAP